MADAAHPTLIAGIHLCGTLAMRAVQLYNECALLGAAGLCLVPCCLPPALKRKAGRVVGGKRWRRLYAIGEHSFDARELEVGSAAALLTPTPLITADAAASANEGEALCEDVDEEEREEEGGEEGSGFGEAGVDADESGRHGCSASAAPRFAHYAKVSATYSPTPN